jgi:hypothetical protein
MAARMRPRASRAGRRRGGGRSTPGGASGLVNRVTGMLGRGAGGRGRRRSGAAGGGLATRATSFVRGFMNGGSAGRRGSATRRGRGRRRY